MRSGNKARRAETTLQCVMLAERRLQWRQLVAGEPLDCDDLVALHLGCKHKAGSDGLAIHQYRAGATDAVLARQMRAGLTKIVPDAIGECRAGLDVGTDRLAVEAEFNLHLILLSSRFLQAASKQRCDQGRPVSAGRMNIRWRIDRFPGLG